ncbi:MAG TPA: class I SAM-dependent methyltransferase [Noviherbaspirillum sp.]
MEQQAGPSSPFPDAAATWNSRFQDGAYIFGTAPNTYLSKHAGLWQPGDRVLCVADGEGRNSVWLAQQGLVVDAFDISEVGVAKAKKLAESAGVSVRYAVSDCDALAWPENIYDGIAAIFIQFADPAMRSRLFANMVRALKPGGALVLQGYTPKQLEYKTGGPPLLSHLYTGQMLQESFAGMEMVELVEYEDELTEGKQHLGRSALVGMVARKR